MLYYDIHSPYKIRIPMQTFQVRDYQTKAIINTLADIRSRMYKSTVLVISTGGGKTFCASQILKGLSEVDMADNEVIVWLAHRKELITQARNTLQSAGLRVATWDAGVKQTGRVITAMIASSKTLKAELDRQGLVCRYVVIDEAHRSAAASYKTRVTELNPDYTLNLTATPIRLDDLELDFDKVSYEVNFLDLVAKGFLAKPRYVSYQTGLSHKLRSSGDEFNKEDMQALNNKARNELIAKDYDKHRAEYGKSLVFCIDVQHAIDLQQEFARNAVGVTTGLVTGGMKADDRTELLRKFSQGIIDVIFNVQVLTEGYDEPTIKSILLARPTKSEVVWSQSVGRASRPHSSKPHFNIVDYVDSENNYGLLSEDWSVRLLGVAESEESKKRKSDAFTMDQFKDWVKETGFSGKTPKAKREVLEIDGVLTVRLKSKTRRFLVRTKHKARLDKMIKYVSSSPPTKGTDMKDYIENYATRYDKSLLRWPGNRALLSLAWGLYHRFVTGTIHSSGQPTWSYKNLPDFSVKEKD